MLNKVLTILNVSLFAVLLFLLYPSMFDNSEASWDRMFSYPLNCVSNAQEEVNFTGGVGEQRRARHCVIRHGSYTEWQNGVLVMEGEYSYGKKTGKWTWYDNTGETIINQENY